jgi:hypothetical protein
MSRRRLPKCARKTRNLHLLLNEHERDALDAGAERFGVELQTYVRTLILAAHSGELPLHSEMFPEPRPTVVNPVIEARP